MEQQYINRPRRVVRVQSSEEMFSLRDVIDIVLQHWGWFVVSSLVCVFMARLYLSVTPRLYCRHAVMLVKEDNTTGTSRGKISTDALLQLNGVLGGSSVKNEVYILQSHQLVEEVVKTLHLDVTYVYSNMFRKVSLYNEKPFVVNFQDEETIPGKMVVRVLNSRECEIYDVEYVKGKLVKSDFHQTVRFGQSVKTPLGTITIVPDEAKLKKFKDKEITVYHADLESATNAVCKQVATSEMDKESTLVQIDCVDTDIQRADDILAALLESYKRSIIQDKNQIAQSTAKFIDERIEIISRELSSVEGELAQFKQNNNIVDLQKNAEAFLSMSTSARQRTIQLQAQQTAVNYLMDYLRDNSNENELIPALGGLTDNAIQTQIAKYNELMLQRNRLLQNSSSTSPLLQEMDATLTQMRQAALASMKGYVATLNLQLRQAQAEENSLLGTMSSVPQKEKHALDIVRQQTIKETLYTYLLNKREETALQLSITEANIRVVERPFGSRNPISPRTKVITMLGLIIGLLIPSVIFWAKAMLNMGVRGRKDVEKFTSIPVIGEIPHHQSSTHDGDSMVAAVGDDPFSEAFRMARFSVNFINKDARVIMFTSTAPGEGKTFVSRNFASTMALVGSRVILVDADIRKRTQSRLVSGGNKEGVTSFLSGATDDISRLVTRIEGANYDILPAGITPPNPAELLMSPRLEEMMAKLKEMYDYVIIDNVPAQVVADAAIVNRVADMTIYVIREGKLDRRYLPELERLHQEKKFNNLCILINDSTPQNKKYGYGYGYGYKEVHRHKFGFKRN